MRDFNPSKLRYEFKNFIGIYENAFTDKECKDAIELFEKYNKCGYTYSRTMQEGNSYFKDDSSVNISPSLELDWDPGFIKSFHNRFYDYIYPIYNHQYPVLEIFSEHKSKYIKIQKTAPSQGYHIWHSEYDSSPSGRDRVLSWILYLNDIEDGGETEFLYQSLRFKPKTGTFILFPAYFTHTHRGNPPLSEIKYIATGWIEFMHTSNKQGESKFPDLSEKIKSKKSISYS